MESFPRASIAETGRVLALFKWDNEAGRAQDDQNANGSGTAVAPRGQKKERFETQVAPGVR